MTIYLYLKTHSITGLKYLGKTNSKDPHKYPGSGLRWKRHLKLHGKIYTTSILLATEDPEELKQTGIFFSKLWNVAESNEWANLKDETGDGGGGHCTEVRNKISAANRLRVISQETRNKIGLNAIKTHTGRKCSEHTKELQRSANINRDYGKWWITNGVESKMIFRDEPIPNGWRRGRKM